MVVTAALLTWWAVARARRSSHADAPVTSPVGDSAGGYGSAMDDELDLAASDGDGDGDEGLLDRMRNMPVGTLDPNIVGDAGPTDVPPGTDPPGAGDLSGFEPVPDDEAVGDPMD